MSNLAYKIRLVLAGIVVSLSVGSLAQISSPPASSTPTFQTATINDNIDSGLSLTVDNDSTGTNASARLLVAADTSSAALFAAGPNRSTALVTNGPTGAQVVFRGLGNYPLVFGTTNTERMRIDGSGNITHNGTEATHDSGSYTADSFGCSTELSNTVSYERLGNVVFIEVKTNGSASCTSDTNTFGFVGTNSPTSIRPSIPSVVAPIRDMQNNGVQASGVCAYMLATGVIQLQLNCSTDTSWTASGGKGFLSTQGSFSFTYRIS